MNRDWEVAAERERCAKIADTIANDPHNNATARSVSESIATDIRNGLENGRIVHIEKINQPIGWRCQCHDCIRVRYDDCHGVYHPFRDHDTPFGWGIRHSETGKIFGYIGEKSACFGVCAALNGKWEAAREFLRGSESIGLGYFDRFPMDYPLSAAYAQAKKEMEGG